MSSFFRFIGLLLIIGGLIIVGMIYGPILNQEFRYQTLKSQSRSQMNEEIIPQSVDFGLVIPKIGVNTQVFADVNPNDPQEYLPLLAQGVAQAKGSALPGEKGTVFIFAHSADSPLNITRYNAVFYLINKLEAGDEILVYFRRAKYRYQVTDKKIVAPELIGEYLNFSKEKNLVLQTCHPPGTTINRLLVIAKEID